MRLWSSANHQLLAKNVYSLTSWWKPLFLETAAVAHGLQGTCWLICTHLPATLRAVVKLLPSKQKSHLLKLLGFYFEGEHSLFVLQFFSRFNATEEANNPPTCVETTGNHSSLLVAKARTTKSSLYHSLRDHFQLATSSNHLPTSLGTVATSGCITSYMQTTFMQCVYDVTWKTATPQWNSRKVFKVWKNRNC